MGKEIKVNVTKANKILDQKQYDTIVERKDTINLSSKRTTKQIKQSISNRKKNSLEGKKSTITSMIMIISLSVLILSVLIRGIGTSVSADIQYNLGEQFANEFEIVLEKEEIVEEDIDNLVDMLQEAVDDDIMVESDRVELQKQHGLIKIEKDETYEELIENGNKYYFEKRLINFVTEGEGAFQPVAFCDSYYRKDGKLIRKSDWNCTYWSIGFGTQGSIEIKDGQIIKEVITLEEGEKRRNDDILRRNSLIKSDCLTENQRIATVDFMYQHGNNSSNIKYYANQCRTNAIFNTIVWWRDAYKGKFLVNKKDLTSNGLRDREQKRINLF